MPITLTGITIYPIKSCGGIDVASAVLEPPGLRHDRRWMVVDGDGRFLTQRDVPRMALIHPALNDDHLVVHAPGMPALCVPLIVSTPHHVAVRVWSDTVIAASVGDEAAEWFSTFLGVKCSLVTMTERSVRHIPSKHASDGDMVSFADAFPLVLISEESLSDLNGRLDVPVPMRRFRPNLVVRGCRPFAEDRWRRIRIGAVVLRVVKPCARCVITTVDTATGERGKEPLRTLATFRSGGNEVFFGQNLLHTTAGTLRVGEEVAIEE